jgi:hypothetical protein
MDPLTLIVGLASAILFSYLGYVLGNYFPVIKRNTAPGQVSPGENLVDTIRGFLTKGAEQISRAVQGLKDGDENKEDDENEAEDIEFSEEQPQPSRPSPAPQTQKAPITPNPDETVQLWHDRKAQKVFAQLDDKLIDLDSPLSTEQHGRLSLLLIDLTEKVGISEGMKSKMGEKVEKFESAEPTDSTPKPVSLNPIRSFINYVQSDVPKIEEKPPTIPEQINAIFQDQIKGTHLESQGITVSDWPGRGVVFIIGIDIYNEIHEIPDSDVRHAIRIAVKTWEKQQGKE